MNLRLICLSVLLVFAQSAYGISTKPLTSVRVVALLDTAAGGNIREGVEAGAAIITNWFRNVFENDELPSLKGRGTLFFLGLHQTGLSPEKIKDHFRTYPVTENEAVMIFYNGHGAAGLNHLGGYYLDMSGGEIGEIELIELSKARWTMLFKDACSSLDNTVAFRERQVTKFKRYSSSSGPSAEELAYQKLFFYPSGELIFRGAALGQYGWVSSNGGFFTNSLFEALSPEEITKYSSGESFDFNKFVTDVSESTSETFQIRKQAAIKALQSRDSIAGLAPRASIVDSADQTPAARGFPFLLFKNNVSELVVFGDVKNRNLVVRSLYSTYGVAGEITATAEMFYPNGNHVVYYDERGAGRKVGTTRTFRVEQAGVNAGRMWIPVPVSELELPGFPLDHYLIRVTLVHQGTIIAHSPFWEHRRKR